MDFLTVLFFVLSLISSLLTGRFAGAALLRGAALCVDATHPYAAEATRNIRAAAAAAGWTCWDSS